MAIDYKELKKGGFMRQKQKDTFSMRLKSVGGHFTAAQLGTVQQVAEKFGAGYIHLTSRQGIEIPFIKAEDIRLKCQSSGYRNSLLLSARELMRVIVHPVIKPHLVQKLLAVVDHGSSVRPA